MISLGFSLPLLLSRYCDALARNDEVKGDRTLAAIWSLLLLDSPARSDAHVMKKEENDGEEGRMLMMLEDSSIRSIRCDVKECNGEAKGRLADRFRIVVSDDVDTNFERF